MTDLGRALQPVVRAFEDLGIAYCLGGSVASSSYGRPRTTLDVDLVVDLKKVHLHPLVTRLAGAYYIDRQMIEEALQHHACFNLIHLETMYKLDVFVLPEHPFDQCAFSRIRPGSLVSEGLQMMFFSPEDVVLHKLYRFRLGGEVSERQWDDVLGVLKVQGSALDQVYMKHWADVLAVLDLLQQALLEAHGIG
jgi:hypothetical protein